jgi:hypothetical protein
MVASQKEHTFCTILTLIKCKTCHLCQNKAWNSSCKCCLPWQDAHVCQVCAHYHLSMLVFYAGENVLICPRRVLCRTHDVKYNLQPLVMAMKEKIAEFELNRCLTHWLALFLIYLIQRMSSLLESRSLSPMQVSMQQLISSKKKK